MPDWMPENNVAKPEDDEARSLKKWNSLLYNTYGDRGPTYFPEGSKPLPSDDEERSWQKINAILKAI